MIRFRFINPDGATEYYEYGSGLWTIGRDAQCDMYLNHASVSSQHATLSHFNGRWLLSDLGSTNGTLINGELIQKRFLNEGDSVHFGAFKCWVEILPVFARMSPAIS